MKRPVVILIGVSQRSEQELKQVLGEAVDLQNEPQIALAVNTAKRLDAKVVLVNIGTGLNPAMRMISELSSAGSQVVALAHDKDPELILQAMRAGAREFVLANETNELARITLELTQRQSQAAQAGSIISVFPSKGGIGATTLATNLAGVLADDGKRTVLVDLDLDLGDVLVFMDIASRYTLADVLSNLNRLDRDLLISSVAKHDSGVHVLAQSDHLEDADKISATQVGHLLTFLAQHFDAVICDGFNGFDEMSLAALDVSQHIVLAMTQDVPSLKNAQRCLDVFGRLGYSAGKVNLVINRYQKGDKIDLQSVADTLGVDVCGVVQNDYPTVMRAINRGVLLTEAAPRAKVTQDIRKLALRVIGAESEATRPSFLRSLFGRHQSNANGQSETESMQGGEPT